MLNLKEKGLIYLNYKRRVTLFIACISYLLVSIGVYYGSSLSEKFHSLIIGFSFMLLAIPSHILGKRLSLFYFSAIILNSLGVGFFITSYYHHIEYSLNLYEYIVPLSISIGILVLFGLITSFNAVRRYSKIITVFLIAILFVLTLIIWLSNDAFTGLTFYYFNIVYFFMIAMISASNDIRDLSKEISLAMFGAFILVSIIVLIIITEGEVIGETVGDVFGEAFNGVFNRKKKK